MQNACAPSKRKGNIIEKDPQLPGRYCARHVVEWFRIPGIRNWIDGKLCFQSSGDCSHSCYEVDEVRCLVKTLVPWIWHRMLG